MAYSVLAYYIFYPVPDPAAERDLQKSVLEPLQALGRIYVSREGINAQLSLTEASASTYISWLKSRPGFEDIYVKIHSWHEAAFPRLTVKVREKLVALDHPVDMSQTGTHLSPAEWKEKLDQPDANRLLIDVRNDYEWKVGRFEGAELPQCNTFREFEAYADALKQTTDPKKAKVMMYCTGGIRCELYSSLLKEKGFENVYQLEGGVIGYGLQEGSRHWQGKLFVFDDRLTVPIAEEPAPVIGECHHCHNSMEAYYNCAHMDCNALFLCCPTCLKQFQGCCSETCQQGPRLRPFSHQNPHKPFRKWYQYFPSTDGSKPTFSPSSAPEQPSDPA